MSALPRDIEIRLQEIAVARLDDIGSDDAIDGVKDIDDDAARVAAELDVSEDAVRDWCEREIRDDNREKRQAEARRLG